MNRLGFKLYNIQNVMFITEVLYVLGYVESMEDQLCRNIAYSFNTAAHVVVAYLEQHQHNVCDRKSKARQILRLHQSCWHQVVHLFSSTL